MSNRFHNKWHRHNHHTYLITNEADSSHDPIASSSDPFKGDFILGGALSASAPTSAYAGIFQSNNTALCAIGDTTGIIASGGTYGIYARGVSQDTGNIMISTWQSDPILPDVSKPAIYADGSIVATKAISANSLWVSQLYATSSIVVVTDMSLTELSGFKVIGTDYSQAIPATFDSTTQQGVLLSGVPLSGSSWAAFQGDLQTHNNLRVDGVAYLSSNEYVVGNSYISGASFIEDALTVTNGNLYVSGNSYIRDNNYVSGSQFVEDGLTITTGNLYVSGNTFTRDNSYISGANFIEDGLTITNGNLYVSGNSYIRDNNYVSGAEFVEDGLTITTGNLYVSGDNYTRDNLYVSGNGFFEDSLTITNGNLYVSGSNIIRDDLYVSGNSFIEDSLIVTAGNLYVSGNSFIRDNNYVSGAEFVEDGLTITNGNLTVNGDVTATNIYANGGNSNNWSSVYSSMTTTSGNWNSVYSTVNTVSADWNSVYSTTTATSAKWDSSYNTVCSLSSQWSSNFYSLTTAPASADGVVYTTPDFVSEYLVATGGDYWYRKYKSGWLEQGGILSATIAATEQVITFPTSFTNINYSFTTIGIYTNGIAGEYITEKTGSRSVSGLSFLYTIPRTWYATGF